MPRLYLAISVETATWVEADESGVKELGAAHQHRQSGMGSITGSALCEYKCLKNRPGRFYFVFF